MCCGGTKRSMVISYTDGRVFTGSMHERRYLLEKGADS